MKSTWQSQWATALGMSLAAAITVGAQAPTTPGQPSAAAGQDRQQHSSVTATGCLQRGTAGSSGEAGAASPSTPGVAAKAEAGFVLRNAKFSGTPAAGSPGAAASPDTTPGAAGQASAPGRAARELRLMAGPGVKFEDHVGHHVSVTGMMGPMAPQEGTSPYKPAPTAGQPATPDNPAATMAGRGPVLTVTSLTMVSATCPAGS